MGDQSRLAC